MKEGFLFLFSFLCLTINSNFVHAQNIKQVNLKDSVIVTAEKNLPIPQVSSIATKMFIPLQNIPLTVGVVNNALINNQNSLILGDALKNISGVNTQTGNGVHDYFIVRGLNSLENSLILTDGTLEPEVTYYNLYNVDRVEVLKGPGAFLYGSNPLSGTVNLVRKKPQFKKFLNIQSSFGQYNAFRNMVDAGYGSTESGIAARLNVLWENAENYRDDKKNEVLAINPSVTYFANKDLSLNLNFEFINSKYKPDSGLPLVFDLSSMKLNKIADVDRTNSYQTPFDFSDQKIIRAKFYADYKIRDNITFSSKTYFSQLDWKSKGTLINGAFPTEYGVFVNRSMSELDDVRDLFGMQNEINIQFKTGNIKHNLITGFEWSVLDEEYSYKVATQLPFISLDNPVESAIEDQITMYPYLSGDVSNKVFAPYLMDQITFSDQLQLIVGVRYDIINFENKAAGYETERDYKNFSPLAGINYTPIKNLTLYANAGKAFAPPSSQVVGEQEAESSQQVEFGVKQRYLNGRVNFDLAYYNITKEGISIPSLDGVSKQQGDLTSAGFEAEIRIEPIKNLFAFISYAYSDVELTKFNESVPVSQDEYGRPIYMTFDRKGNRTGFSPEHILNIWMTKEFENGFGIGGGLRYLSEQFIHIDNAFELDAALIFDGIVYYKWNQIQFSVNVKNICDEKYEMRGFGNSSVIPANPRSVYGKISFTL